MKTRLYARFVFLVGTLALVTGCATNRGILDVRVVQGTEVRDGKNVAVTTVTDMRRFELHPSVPSTPSLKLGEIEDVAITSRAIARKRNGWGKAIGDILLPEGRKVEDVVREAVSKALVEKGYRVVPADTSGAIPVEVEIQKFWSWMTPGFWALSLDFQSLVIVKSPLVSNGDSAEVHGDVQLHTQAARGSAWLKTINLGLEDLVTNLKGALRDP